MELVELVELLELRVQICTRSAVDGLMFALLELIRLHYVRASGVRLFNHKTLYFAYQVKRSATRY